MKNRKVMEKGACISISCGSNVDVWDSPWIPLMLNYKPRPNVNLVDLPDFSVAGLILPGERVWNSQLLFDLFFFILLRSNAFLVFIFLKSIVRISGVGVLLPLVFSR